MGKSLTRKIIEEHLVDGEPVAGSEIALRIKMALFGQIESPREESDLTRAGF